MTDQGSFPGLDDAPAGLPPHARRLDPDAPTPGLARNDHPDTAKLAALRAAPRTGTARRRVLMTIANCGADGATDEEIQHSLGMNPSTQRPRRVELVQGGWIEDSGKRRRTLSGDQAIVWVIRRDIMEVGT